MWLTLPSQITILFATHYNKLSLKILWYPFSFITKEFLLFKEAVVWSPFGIQIKCYWLPTNTPQRIRRIIQACPAIRLKSKTTNSGVFICLSQSILASLWSYKVTILTWVLRVHKPKIYQIWPPNAWTFLYTDKEIGIVDIFQLMGCDLHSSSNQMLSRFRFCVIFSKVNS